MPGDLSEHFSKVEFLCRDNCGFGNNPGDISSVLIDSLEKLRAIVNLPIVINCGCRCVNHNTAVGGEPHSKHIEGIAADICIPGLTPQEICDAALQVSAFQQGGIGLANWGCHLDTRTSPGRWAYDSNNRVIPFNQFVPTA
jgi:uncharacterized protein YcbK (DUF882 family)